MHNGFRQRALLRLGCAMMLTLLAPAAMAAPPTVYHVRADLRQGQGTQLVDIRYNLSDPDSSSVTVTIAVSTNDGQSYDLPAPSMSNGGSIPSIGSGVGPGNDRWVVWDAGKDWGENYSDRVRFRVTADDTPVPSGMVLIPAGSFRMGDFLSDGSSDEMPVHTVYVSPFYMDRCEVTKALWDEVYAWATGHGYSFETNGRGKAANHPAYSVSWYSVVKWCNARSQKEGRTACYTVGGTVYKTGQNVPDCNWSVSGYRLPTEAEWEKAARGGASARRFPWRDSDTIQHARANYCSVSSYGYDTSPTRGFHPTYNVGVSPPTSPVGAFAANGYGLYDMAGNVWEWCWDWYGSSYYGSSPGTDPRGPASGSRRVTRGGCWFRAAFNCRVADREYALPEGASHLGFRAVLSPGQ
jgi:formylglycine-generating enzyme